MHCQQNDVPSVDGFWKFVLLRQEAYWNKMKGIHPLSEDPFIANNHVPNVFRELDKGTIYFQENRFSSPKNVFFQSVIYRIINRQKTFQAFDSIPIPDEYPDFRDHLISLSNSNVPIFTGRHQTPGMGKLKMAISCLELRGSEIWDYLDRKCDSLERVHEVLKADVPGVSGFFAWQIICDLMESGCFPRFTENDWAYLGPGPIKAIQMINGKMLSQRASLSFARKTLLKGYPQSSFPYPERIKSFTLKNVEHSLCEYFRYMQFQWGNLSS